MALASLDDEGKDIIARRYLADEKKRHCMILLMSTMYLLKESDRLRMEH